MSLFMRVVNAVLEARENRRMRRWRALGRFTDIIADEPYELRCPYCSELVVWHTYRSKEGGQYGHVRCPNRHWADVI
jgi:hypothetical protein